MQIKKIDATSIFKQHDEHKQKVLEKAEDIYDLDIKLTETSYDEIPKEAPTRTHCSQNCGSNQCGTAGRTCLGTCVSCGVTCMGTCENCRC